MVEPVYISHDTALEYLRRQAELGSRATWSSLACTLPPKAPTHETMAALRRQFTWSAAPLHLLVSDARGRRKIPGCAFHICPQELPPGAFVEYQPFVRISSPEFVFIQMAGKLTLPQTVQLALELCGRYVLVSDTHDGHAQIAHPLTTPTRISAFLEQMPRFPGIKQARRALTWILPNSRSPMETDLAMLLFLPVSVGGKQFPRPTMNAEIPLTGEFRSRANCSRYYIDLFWPEHSLGIEYDSRAEHSNRYRSNQDKKRVEILSQLGITIKTFTEFTVMRMAEFDTACRGICREMGRRYQPPTETRMQKELALRKQLFARFGPHALIG